MTAPVVVVCCSREVDDDDVVARVPQQEIAAFLKKPYTPSDLVGLVEAVLGARRSGG